MGMIMQNWIRHAINMTRLYIYGMAAVAGGIGVVASHAGHSG